MAKDKEPIAWITRGGKHIPIFADEPTEDEKNKDRQIAENKKQAEEKDIFKRDKWFDQATYDKLPKKMQVKNIVSIGKERHGSDGTRYNASLVWEDGFSRSVSEYGWADFKDYLSAVLFNDRKEQR